ncbi:protein adenylyltransferase SelO family protein [Amaricoccus macauensis]|uniref:protein adenylyltransferase SelO family protein n=1 Tax=Amaricoccus macauensis TaxID=57001 RepID=UPI003C7CB159
MALSSTPVLAQMNPETTHLALGSEFHDVVQPASFPQARLRFRNDAWATRVGLNDADDQQWVAHFARFEPLPGSLPEPIALRYHGHQFRVYNPDLGDGRGFLFAQLRDLEDGRLLDLGTKGSGTTPWSRGGDGRLTLKGGVREILATEMLEALGVYTSKTFSLVETGEALTRGDEPSPTRSAVLVRLSHSHIRIGTFQRLAVHRQLDEMRALVEHCATHFWPEARETDDLAAGLYACICDATARMGAEWYAAGFVHGVLNTDNTNITGESFDYGPWRFQDRYDPLHTAAYFDHNGLYAFARQPEALSWNLARLGECLLAIAPQDAIEPVYQDFPIRFQRHLERQTFARLGLISPGTETSNELMHLFWTAMHETTPPFQQVFHDLLGGGLPERIEASEIRDTYQTSYWPRVKEGLRGLETAPGLGRALAHPSASESPETMVIEEVEAIWDAIARDDDWSLLQKKIDRIRKFAGLGKELGLLRGPNARPHHAAL